MGGDEFNKNCIEMDEWIIDELDLKNPLISILPTASTNQKPELAISNAMNYFDAFGAKVDSVPIYSREDSNNSNGTRTNHLLLSIQPSIQICLP